MLMVEFVNLLQKYGLLMGVPFRLSPFAVTRVGQENPRAEFREPPVPVVGLVSNVLGTR